MKTKKNMIALFLGLFSFTACNNDDDAQGKYDFIIIVTDQNGTKLEETKNITLYAAGNLPVNPVASIFNVHKNDAAFFRKGKYTLEGDSFKTADKFASQVTLSGVKGDGKMYLLLIHKNTKHIPESIDQIDFNKVIVYDVAEHKDMTEVGNFSNVTFDKNNTVNGPYPSFLIGAAKDNNIPNSQDITGSRTWSSGDYNFVVVYKNITYNINWSQAITIPIAL